MTVPVPELQRYQDPLTNQRLPNTISTIAVVGVFRN